MLLYKLEKDIIFVFNQRANDEENIYLKAEKLLLNQTNLTFGNLNKSTGFLLNENERSHNFAIYSRNSNSFEISI